MSHHHSKIPTDILVVFFNVLFQTTNIVWGELIVGDINLTICIMRHIKTKSDLFGLFVENAYPNSFSHTFLTSACQGRSLRRRLDQGLCKLHATKIG